MSIARYFHTLRHLRSVQFLGRVRRLLPQRPNTRPAPRVRERSGRWLIGPQRQAVTSSPGTFRFLNQTYSISSPADWREAPVSRLWMYNLHYHDALNGMDSKGQTDLDRWLLQEWVRHNPPGSSPGWEPYPTSLRIVNWVRWALSGGATEPYMLHSLAVQARWLQQRLEYHLLGNHLWANAKALVFAGGFFEGAEANELLHQGLRLLERELDEQVLSDGGHIERSPMYQATLTEDLLDLRNLALALPDALPERFVKEVSGRASRMLRWLKVMSHPDGRISFFNDSAFGVAPDYQGLRAYALRLGVDVDDAPLDAVEALPESGYVRLQGGRAVVICDVAPVGPDYQPGHAHADTLSFELSLDGRRLFVNSGTSTYETGSLRSWQRSTAAHNTVEVDGADSSEVWAAFRVARRARPRDARWEQLGQELTLTCAHDGYRRLRGRVMHRRRWVLRPDELLIEDELEGEYREAIARLHVHPDFVVGSDDARAVALMHRGEALSERVSVTVVGASELAVRKGAWYPEFNFACANHHLGVKFEGEQLTTRVRW